ncbi:DUF6220 domain-containing protein [Chamaesiphon polymorphus]|uniref:Uncharacterized protein n=1 Tax=Chamaesiphon polymorphus CCALA 037 TaxID=2107692 RepID=A0A2T1GNQ5_9CYAN|nr:DUF6220 domain-containing protein [Chamaesiphon polymorphus]PSB59516.1 hypothetical protein C7B77_00540 [Chamaesiphon polymorphus CCALA 037]
MTIDLPSDRTQISRSWTQISFLAIAILFNLCLVLQLLTVGLAIFYDSSWWQIHVLLVRGYSGLLVLLLGGLFVTPFPRKIKMLTGSMSILLVLQFITIHTNSPIPLGIIHPLIGFSLFTTSTTLVHRAWRSIRDRE